MQLPITFIQDITRLLGKEQATLFLESLQEIPSVSIRMNPHKLPHLSLEASLPRVPWCTLGHYLPGKLTFTFDPLFHAGGYYAQEASSMFLGHALHQYVQKPVCMLDLCAAPGGKTSLARDVLPAGSLLIANELVPSRAQILLENVQKWGHPDTLVISNLPAEIGTMDSLFDVILTDVPCSGEGMFRKDPVSIQEWSPENVALCAKRQREILRDIWPSLKPDGLLIYSTCTYNTHENEENIAWIAHELGAEVLPLSIDSEWNITGNLGLSNFPVYRFLPHRTRGEGLFMAILRKKPDKENAIPRPPTHSKRTKQDKKKNNRSVPHSVSPLQLLKWMNDSTKDTEWILSVSTDGIHSAIRHDHFPILQQLRETGIRILSPGVVLATQKGKDFIPHTSLALSQVLNKEAFPQVELTYQHAISYLRRETISLPATTPTGYILVTYQDLPLGFVKNIGSRTNNLYPSEWRIRSSYNPKELKLLEQSANP